jgi:succinate dehydrogenase / fumarate reductase membrane anchor subunit
MTTDPPRTSGGTYPRIIHTFFRILADRGSSSVIVSAPSKDFPYIFAIASASAFVLTTNSSRANWWAERVSAVALVPLTLWFVASIIAHTGSDYANFIMWLRAPAVMILMILFLIALFHHTALGLQVIIENYVHSGAKFAVIVTVRLGCAALAVIGIVSVLRIGLAA